MFKKDIKQKHVVNQEHPPNNRLREKEPHGIINLLFSLIIITGKFGTKPYIKIVLIPKHFNEKCLRNGDPLKLSF